MNTKKVIIKEGTAQEIEDFANDNSDFWLMTDLISNNNLKEVIDINNPNEKLYIPRYDYAAAFRLR